MADPSPTSAAPTIERDARLAVVVMGVSGSGKSTLGLALGRALHLEFVDGDDLHPPHNLAKMRGGRPLDDDDRRPWLEAVAAALADDAAFAAGVVVACSSLKRAYRERLRRAAPVRFVFLDADRALIERRFAGRSDPLLPRELIASQFLALERPAASETDVLRRSSMPCSASRRLACWTWAAARDGLRACSLARVSP